MDWTSPVPFFGDLERAVVGTVGINPSNQEFESTAGDELEGTSRRLPTLDSVGLECWGYANYVHVRQIADSCTEYFGRNPYDRWFRRLDDLLAPAEVSFYSGRRACHLDLVPFATGIKWGELPVSERRLLLDMGRSPLAELIRSSPIVVLVLNGRSVVKQFESFAGVQLDEERRPAWDLARSSGRAVKGYSYSTQIDTLAGLELDRTVTVLGYNHNIQSSFGVTRQAIDSISAWLAESIVARIGP